MIDEVLAGGNMEPVVRVGDTVRRTTGDWTPAVHQLLDAWAAAAIVETPRAIGVDEHGREVLGFLEGEMLSDAAPEVLWSTQVLHDAGVLLRRMHDASAPLAHDDLVWRSAVHPPVEVVCHNDVAPYNLVHRQGRLAGVIDADMASPGSRLWDLAYLAYRLAPDAEDAHAFDAGAFGSREQRIAQLVAAYGAAFSVEEVRAMAAVRLDDLAAFTEKRALDTGRDDLAGHAAMYRRDAARLRAAAPDASPVD